jgi:phytoene dehydrogenase-like protein
MSAALEKGYDGIILGAGHHGLVLGSYLAKSGLDILLVDRRLKYGGGLSTEEATAPGFYHNLHSINHFHITETPWFKDLGLADRVGYITPRYELGQPHLDGSVLVFGRDLEETLANVARFSKKDAQTFRDWNRKAEEITERIFLPERYAEPLPQAEREALLNKSAIGRDFLAVCARQPFDVVKELFENEHVQLLFLFKVSLFGTWLVDTMSKTSPMGSVIRAFDLQSGYQLCQGGSFNLARGLMETFIAAGGRFEPQVDVERIVVEGGKATGIALRDGRTVRARQFVASTLDVHQTFETYIGRAQLPAASFDELSKVVGPGQEVTVAYPDGRRMRGKVGSVTESALVLNPLPRRLFRRQGVQQSIVESSVTTVTRMDSPLEGLLLGFAAGYVPTAIAGCDNLPSCPASAVFARWPL